MNFGMLQSVRLRWLDSSFTRRIDVIATMAAIVLVFHLALKEDLSWLGGAAVFIGVAALAAIKWPYGALCLLLGASALPVFFVTVSGWKARPEHFAGVFILAVLIVRRMVSRTRWRLESTDYWIAGYIVFNF